MTSKKFAFRPVCSLVYSVWV